MRNCLSVCLLVSGKTYQIKKEKGKIKRSISFAECTCVSVCIPLLLSLPCTLSLRHSHFCICLCFLHCFTCCLSLQLSFSISLSISFQLSLFLSLCQYLSIFLLLSGVSACLYIFILSVSFILYPYPSLFLYIWTLCSLTCSPSHPLFNDIISVLKIFWTAKLSAIEG